MHPVLIERVGQDMQATTAGQISYLNPDATKGEVLFSVNANSGDILAMDQAPGNEQAINALLRLLTEQERWGEVVEVYDHAVSSVADDDTKVTRNAKFWPLQFVKR